MIQACINQPGNLEANMKSLNLRLPTLTGQNQQSKIISKNVALYKEFLKDDKLSEDLDFLNLPNDLQREVNRGKRSLKGAMRVFKGKWKCNECGQWRSSQKWLDKHPCGFKLILPICPYERSNSEFPFISTKEKEDDVYKGCIVQIFTDLYDTRHGQSECNFNSF